MIEGPHLVAAYLERGRRPHALLASESGMEHAEIALLVRRAAVKPILLSDPLFRAVADAEAPSGIAAEIEIESIQDVPREASLCVFLEAIQDAGNVGTIIRSAAAFGADTVVLGKGCADPWSPKALRAGMGGHFAVGVAETEDLLSAVDRFGATVICTVPRGGTPLRELDLSGRLGWIFGSEGQGVSDALAARAACRATIPMAGGAESLNVAAAAAICLYEVRRQLSNGDAQS